MTNLSSILDPVIWGLAPIVLLVFIAVAVRPNAAARTAASVALLVAGFMLVAGLTMPALLPAASALKHPDGSSGDPRIVSALLLGLATLAALFPGVRALRLSTIAQASFWLPGIVVGLLVAVGGYLLGLRHTPALAGLVLGGTVFGSAVAMAVRLRGERSLVALALQAGGLGVVVLAAMLALHGARAERLQFDEGASIDTLGTRVTYLVTEAPHDSLRRLRFALTSKARTDTVWAELRGRANAAMRSEAAGRVFGGPVLVPLALQETRGNPHGVTWIKKGESITVGAAQLKFEKFRFVMGDTIRLYADLEVTHGGRTTKVSPGAIANSKGETPFSATVEGFGPIAIAGVDADNGRVGLVLPTPVSSAYLRTALVELRLRPAMELAWVGAALAVLAFLFVFGAAPSERTEAGRA